MYFDRSGLKLGRKDVFDYTSLGKLMVAWLRKFKEVGKQGCPHDYLIEAVGRKEEYSDEDIDKGLKLLYKDIDDLIWALEDNEPDSEDMEFDEWVNALINYNIKRDTKLCLFQKLYLHLWR